MKNIDYLELFFRKHNLSGRITVKYTSDPPDDDYMSNIIFENGDIVHINDIIFDIESELENDVFEQWMDYKRTDDISFMDWMQTDNHYMPKNIDMSSMEEYQKEMEEIFEDVKNSIDKVFTLEQDIEDENE